MSIERLGHPCSMRLIELWYDDGEMFAVTTNCITVQLGVLCCKFNRIIPYFLE